MATKETIAIDWDEMLREEMDWAIAQRKSVQGEEEFQMRVKVIGPHGEIANTPIQWRSNQEKYRWMHALSGTCKILNAQAAIVVSDARFLNVPVFCETFGIAEPTKDTFEKFNRERAKVMERFDNYMGNLPSDTYKDSLLVTIYGPKITRMATTEYRNVDGKFVFEPMSVGRDETVTVFMIPKWWD